MVGLGVVIFVQRLKEVGRQAVWVPERRAWQAEATANAKALTCGTVFFIGRTSRRLVLLL